MVFPKEKAFQDRLAVVKQNLKDAMCNNRDEYIYIFLYFDSLRPSQQFFSHVGTRLPMSNQF